MIVADFRIFNNLWTKKSLWIKIICDNPIKNYICDNLWIKIQTLALKCTKDI